MKQPPHPLNDSHWRMEEHVHNIFIYITISEQNNQLYFSELHLSINFKDQHNIENGCKLSHIWDFGIPSTYFCQIP